MIKHIAILAFVEERFKAIHQLSHKIVKEFNADDIHKFRLEVKNLRAFLRLLDEEKEINKPLIPKQLKTFYGYVAIIRNIQLHRHNLFKYITDYAIELPETYIQIIDDEKKYWEREATDLMADNSFEENENEIIKQLPDNLQKSTAKKFVEKKLHELKEQLKDVKDDKAIHTMRKILKDILYTWDFIDIDDLPETISKKEDLKRITALLGDFRDECIQIEFLSDEYLSKITDNTEKITLIQMKEQFMRQKKIILQQLIYSFNKINEKL